jgi:hypothetical protein
MFHVPDEGKSLGFRIKAGQEVSSAFLTAVTVLVTVWPLRVAVRVQVPPSSTIPLTCESISISVSVGGLS